MPVKNIARNIRRKIAGAIADKPADSEKVRELYSNIILSAIKSGRSTRKYSDCDVPDELIEKILEAASHAPSAGDFQPYEFIIVKNAETRKYISESCKRPWMAEAPVHIVACTNMKIASMYEERGMKLYGIQDTALAVGNLMLAAEALGLRTCWVGAFGEAQVSILLHCPEYVRPAAIITLGYSDEKVKEPPKHGLKKFAHREKFGERWGK
ncbi:MAG: nitroreductase family protein [Nanoarchaeota archaeon]|nr:nitroreductase family protein [Nanoarchaeota archaeon]